MAGRFLSWLRDTLGLPRRRPVAGGIPPALLRGAPQKGTLRFMGVPVIVDPNVTEPIMMRLPEKLEMPKPGHVDLPDAIRILRIAQIEQPFNTRIPEALRALGVKPLDSIAVLRRKASKTLPPVPADSERCPATDCDGARCTLATGHDGLHKIFDSPGFRQCTYPECKTTGVCVNLPGDGGPNDAA